MTNKRDNTYDRRILLGASRRRLEDAQALSDAKRWTGAMYLGGYAIECSLKALICQKEGKMNLLDTTFYQDNEKSVQKHNLRALLEEALPQLKRAIKTDRSKDRDDYNDALTRMNDWQTNELRYCREHGNQEKTEGFMNAVKKLHSYILGQLGETS